ncbi:MAG: D-alanyl-D-alanine carboxypeptidase [Clostridia bacterium]|nr:D-alanyl-D-alanine carboxypeptidase [Clostridia bacterium]
MKVKKILAIFFSIIIVFISTYSFAIDLDPEKLYAESAILIDSKTGKVLFEKNMDKKMYPASTTKIMTAILTIENCNIEDKVVVNYNAISSIPNGYSTAELITDEELTVKQLLEVLLVHSANDAANVLGMHVGGSIDSFVAMMNSKAQELGCTNTQFTNTYGLHDENHYTTARDLAIIAKYCMQNSTFRHFVSQPNCQIAPTNKHIARSFNNTNDLINTSSKNYYKYAIGIKTGYTKEAGNCLISCSNKDGFETIAVVLNTGTTHGARYEDSISIFNYAFNTFGIKKVAGKNDVITQITVNNGSKDTKNLDLLLAEDVNALTFINNDSTKIEPTINLNKNISAPIAAGSVVGNVTYNILNTEYKVDLIASHDVEKSEFLIITLRIFVIVIIVIVVIILISKIFRKKIS